MASRAFSLIDAVAARRPPSPRRNANMGATERVTSGVVGGALLAWALSRGTVRAAVAGVVGGALLYRGARGRSRLWEAVGMTTAGPSARVECTGTVNRSPGDVHELCRDVQNLRRIVPGILAVTPTSEGAARWIARTPSGETRSWDARLAVDTPGEMVRWQSDDGPGMSFSFRRGPAERGSEVRITLEDATGADAEEAVRRLKQLAESGEIPTTAGQPAGRPD